MLQKRDARRDIPLNSREKKKPFLKRDVSSGGEVLIGNKNPPPRRGNATYFGKRGDDWRLQKFLMWKKKTPSPNSTSKTSFNFKKGKKVAPGKGNWKDDIPKRAPREEDFRVNRRNVRRKGKN